MSDDTELLRRYVDQKSEPAFSELVDRHVGLVYSAALRRCGDAHGAADISQRVFTALASQARCLTGHTVLTGWLYSTTRNLTIDHIRTERRRRAREEEAARMNEPVSKSEAIDWHKIRPILDQAMDNLSDVDRTAVLLRFFDRRRFAEIGEILSISEDAARMRVERATGKLRHCLSRYGITSTAEALGTLLATETLSAAPAGVAAGISHAALLAAITGAAATPLSVGFVLQLMTATKFVVTLGVLGVLATTTAICVRHQAQSAMAESDRQVHENQVLTERLGAIRTHVANLQADNTDLQRRLASLQQAFSAAQLAIKAADSPREINAPAGTALSDRMRTDPEFRQLYLEHQRVAADLRYLPLYRSLHFTAEQRTRFSDLLAAAAQKAAEESGSQDAQASASLREQIRSAFGSDADAAYADFTRQSAPRSMISQLLTKGSFANFSADQAEQMVAIISQASPSYQNGRDWMSAGVNWDEVAQQSSKFLTAEQLNLVQSLAAQVRQREMVATVATPPTP
jgi:RNA polymerase sigma factor (sigma-70 family)